MVFNSVAFMYYFLPVVIGVFFLVKPWPRLQNLWLLAASFLFYGWCNGRYLAFLAAFGLVNYGIARCLGYWTEKGKEAARKWTLFLGVSLNLLCLFAVKYLNFSIGIANRLLGGGLAEAEALFVPLGISFLVFSMISYLADISRNRIVPLKDLTDHFLYVSFFSKVSQGPIARCGEFQRAREITLEQLSGGFRRFAFGLAKKVLIADVLGASVDLIFQDASAGIPTAVAWTGMVCYTFQIYFDFSGYTDMAIGLGSIFGFHLPENFDSPYLSRSVSEFWRRWHMTLGTWFREYVYIPMGGNRKGLLRTCINLAVVWLLTGIWHGAAFTYILWGISMGTIIIFEKLVGKSKWYSSIPSGVKWLGTFFAIMLSWVLFRSNGIGSALRYILMLFGIGDNPDAVYGVRYYLDNGTLLALVSGAVLCAPLPDKMRDWMKNTNSGLLVSNGMALVLLSLALLFMVNSTYNAFIYFQF